MKTIFTIISLGFALCAHAQTSKDNPKLQDALERFPQADANGDGVLTLEEAKGMASCETPSRAAPVESVVAIIPGGL